METTQSKLPDSGNFIAVCRRIVERKQYEYFMDADGNNMIVDLFSASAIITVYDALSEENQKKLSNLHPLAAQKICLKLIK